jgi:hypothetical protein
MTTFSNLKTYLPSALKHLFDCHFKHLWKKTEYHCNVVYVPKSSTTFGGILICSIFRPRDMQEYYMLFGIFAKDVGLYSLSVSYITWTDFQYTNIYLFCVLHTYYCASFTRECHGTTTLQAQTTSIYDVIGHIDKYFFYRHWNTFSIVISNIFGKKRNIIVTFQSGQLTEQPKTLDDLGHFDLKMFRNCPNRIEIITGSHIFILFLTRVITLCLHFTPRYHSW